MEANGQQQMKAVFTVVERAGKSHWVRLGVGFVNRDGSITLKLDAIPVNGTLQVREWEAEGARRGGGGGGDGEGRSRPRGDEFGGPARA